MNKWDQRYASDDYAYGTQPNDFLKQHAKTIPNGPVLCLADGEGRNGVYLAELGYAVTSVDFSAVGLRKAQRLAAMRRVSLNTIHSDLANFDFKEGRYAGIVSIFCHLPSDLRRSVYRNALRALRPGGVLLLEAYTPEQLHLRTGGPPSLDLLASLDDLKQDLEGMEFVVAEQRHREILEGKLHTGVGAVAQILARRPLAPDHQASGSRIDLA